MHKFKERKEGTEVHNNLLAGNFSIFAAIAQAQQTGGGPEWLAVRVASCQLLRANGKVKRIS